MFLFNLNSSLALTLTYNSDTDCFGMVIDGVWKDILFAGFKSFYIFKENFGLQNECTIRENGGTGTTSVSLNKIDMAGLSPNGSGFYANTTVFNVDLSKYVGKGKKIYIEYSVSTTNFSNCNGYWFPSATSDVNRDPTHKLDFSNTDRKTITIDIDSSYSSVNPFFGLAPNSNKSSFHLYIYNMYIK